MPPLTWVVLVFYADSLGRLGLEFDCAIQRQGGEFMFELRNIFVSMDNGFHLDLKNREAIILMSRKAA